MDQPKIIEGGLSVDDRGQLSCVNGFDFKDSKIRRFYTVSNHQQGFVRAWHGHKFESKYVMATLMFFSTTTLEQSRSDDFRFHFKTWNIWEVERR